MKWKSKFDPTLEFWRFLKSNLSFRMELCSYSSADVGCVSWCWRRFKELWEYWAPACSPACSPVCSPACSPACSRLLLKLNQPQFVMISVMSRSLDWKRWVWTHHGLQTWPFGFWPWSSSSALFHSRPRRTYISVGPEQNVQTWTRLHASCPQFRWVLLGFVWVCWVLLAVPYIDGPIRIFCSNRTDWTHIFIPISCCPHPEPTDMKVLAPETGTRSVQK